LPLCHPLQHLTLRARLSGVVHVSYKPDGEASGQPLGIHAMQITSLLLHWMPACVLWTLRWYPDRSVKLDYDNRSDAAKAICNLRFGNP
jgi:hypothetical protein